MTSRRFLPAAPTARLALAVGLLCAGACAPAPPARYPHVILISLDTLRADHLGCQGNAVVETPAIDAFAAEGTRFRSASTVVPTTLSSHTSIMTGLYPRRHGVVRNGFMVNEGNVMLAEVLRDEGFHTAAFLGSYALDRAFDFNQGFDHYDAEFDIEYKPRVTDQNQRRADAVTDAALSHLDELGGLDEERLFLFVHYFDPHSPFDAPEPMGPRYVREEGPRKVNIRALELQVKAHQLPLIGQYQPVFAKGLNATLVREADGTTLPGDEDYAALYGGEVTYLDFHVGRLLEGLRERGVLDDAIVIITGDHGETFWEHGDFWHHGAWVYETNLHVPLIVRMPDGRGKGEEVADPVATIDIFPTLLELLEIPLPEAVDGISLVGALDGQPLRERPIFGEATQPTGAEGALVWKNQLKAKSVRLGRWKYIRAPYLGGLEELYDLEADPEERVNLLGLDDPAALQQLPVMRQAVNQWMSVRQPRESSYNSELADEVMRKLAALGYTGKALKEPPPEDPPGVDEEE